ncbi:MAG: 3-deoxy-manno-octulosonate cytidylyltransferase [Bacteroidetes bacterium]|nr:3-deoxy-manno-octulosonate cytidylyltransferase [Bacteroidota bacterium]
MNIIVIIPARYGSTRFPGKPLAEINGMTMIQRVYNQCKMATRIKGVVVATDDKRILKHVQSFGGHAVMTNHSLPSGTDRCAAALELLSQPIDAVINVQGDEPFIHPEQIDEIAALLWEEDVLIATLIKESADPLLFSNPNCVKAVVDANKKELYFSRSAIPYVRDDQNRLFYRHIGIYGYQAEILKQLVTLPPTPLELAEKLEQLRWLENGYSIQTATTRFESHGIDTPEDLDLIIAAKK